MAESRCPCCGALLFPTTAPDTTLLVCKQCSGIWLDNAGSRLAAEARLSELARQVARALDDSLPAVRQESMQAYRAPAPELSDARRCPVCRAALTRAKVEIAGAELDICAAHGTWFDRHELWAVVQAVSLQKFEAEREEEREVQRIRQAFEAAHGAPKYKTRTPGAVWALGFVLKQLLG